jgi:hypothetical protein
MPGDFLPPVSESSLARSAIAPLRTNSAAGANRRIGLRLLQAFVDRGCSAIRTIRPQTRNDSSVDDVSLQIQ